MINLGADFFFLIVFFIEITISLKKIDANPKIIMKKIDFPFFVQLRKLSDLR